MQNIRLSFVGDTTVTGRFIEPISNNSEILSQEIRNIFASSDEVIANLEGPITSTIEHLKCNGLVVGPKDSFKYFAERGITIVNLANNHIFDNGISGFEDTVEEVQMSGVRHFGAGANIDEAKKPVIISKNGIKVAIYGISHNEGLIADSNEPGIFCSKDINIVKNEIKDLKLSDHFIIICYHGGEEFTLLPSPTRRRLQRNLIAFGADLVVANHSHVVQGHEIYKNKLIYNSLGNFVFDIPEYRGVPYTDSSIILSVDIYEDKTMDFKVVPIDIDFSKPSLYIAKDEKLISRISEFSNVSEYWRKWCFEAERVYFLKKQDSQNNDFQSTAKKSLFFRACSLLRKMIKNPARREIVIGAIVSRFFLKSVSQKSKM